MKLRKLTALLLCIVTAISFTACNKTGTEGAGAPDYSGYTDKFDFYGYTAVTDGTYRLDGAIVKASEDLRTEEKIREYKEAGMTIFFPQSQAQVTGNDPEGDWEKAKVIWDRAVAAGFEKRILMRDVRILMLANGQGNPGKDVSEFDPEGIIGPTKQFANEDALDEAMYGFISLYKDHPGFYGVMLNDEPSINVVIPYGQVYQSIRRVSEKYDFDCYVQYNLLPMRAAATNNAFTSYPLLDGFNSVEEEIEHYGVANQELTCLAYEKYVTEFLDALYGIDYVMFDDYPLRGTEKNGSVMKEYVREMQIVAKVAKEKGVKFYNVTQTFAGENQKTGDRTYRYVKRAEADWLNNILLMFGVKQIAYYTYMPHQSNTTNNLFHLSDGSFIDREGNKTPLYDIMQAVMKENQAFAPTYMQFEYQTSKVIIKSPLNSTQNHADWAIKDCEFVKAKDVQINKEYALVSELYDDENGNYMYAVQNIVDTTYLGSKFYQTATITFDANEYDYALVYRNGEPTVQKLENGVLTIKNAPGEAAFAIPYKSK